MRGARSPAGVQTSALIKAAWAPGRAGLTGSAFPGKMSCGASYKPRADLGGGRAYAAEVGTCHVTSTGPPWRGRKDRNGSGGCRWRTEEQQPLGDRTPGAGLKLHGRRGPSCAGCGVAQSSSSLLQIFCATPWTICAYFLILNYLPFSKPDLRWPVFSIPPHTPEHHQAVGVPTRRWKGLLPAWEPLPA